MLRNIVIEKISLRRALLLLAEGTSENVHSALMSLFSSQCAKSVRTLFAGMRVAISFMQTKLFAAFKILSTSRTSEEVNKLLVFT